MPILLFVCDSNHRHVQTRVRSSDVARRHKVKVVRVIEQTPPTRSLVQTLVFQIIVWGLLLVVAYLYLLLSEHNRVYPHRLTS